MFDGDHDWLDDLTNDMDPLHVYDLDGDGYTTFDEEYLLTHDHDEDSQNVSPDDDYNEFSDELDEYDRDEYDMDDSDEDNYEDSDEQSEECDEYDGCDSYDDESDASMDSIDEKAASQKPEKLLYAKVKLGDSSFGYSYRCNESIKAGDKVIVPVGDKQEISGTVVSVNSFTPDRVPYPIEKTKFILRKVEENTSQDGTANQYAALANTLQKVVATRTYATKSDPIRPAYASVNLSFPNTMASHSTVTLSERGNFGIAWFAFSLVCFFPLLFAEFALDAIFFDPGAIDGIHVFLAFVACIACGFGYARYERAKAKKDSEALHNAKILSISIAVICVVISLIIIGISSANEKERQMEKDRLLSSSRRPYYSTSIKSDTSSYTSSSSKSTSSSKRTSSRKSSSSKSSSDSYNAKDYAHPDDFYYDHYDDFVDFEEAEDYWDSYN